MSQLFKKLKAKTKLFATVIGYLTLQAESKTQVKSTYYDFALIPTTEALLVRKRQYIYSMVSLNRIHLIGEIKFAAASECLLRNQADKSQQ